VATPVSAPRARAGVPTHPWASLSDLELFNKVFEHSLASEREGRPGVGFSRRLLGARPRFSGEVYAPSDDPVTTAIFPFVIQMDRLRLGAMYGSARLPVEVAKQQQEMDKQQAQLEAAMFAELERQVGPPAAHHYPSPASGGSWGGVTDSLGLINDRLLPYRTKVYEQEKKRKETEAVAAAAARAKADRDLALEELGEIRLIGRQYYIVKDNEVFAIANQTVPPRTPRTAGLTCAQIRVLRGGRAFANMNEAEAHWAAIEDQWIVAEARRRLAEEQRIAAAAADVANRENRILVAMQNLRNNPNAAGRVAE
jgi:hypothetical protein